MLTLVYFYVYRRRQCVEYRPFDDARTTRLFLCGFVWFSGARVAQTTQLAPGVMRVHNTCPVVAAAQRRRRSSSRTRAIGSEERGVVVVVTTRCCVQKGGFWRFVDTTHTTPCCNSTPSVDRWSRSTGCLAAGCCHVLSLVCDFWLQRIQWYK